MTRDQKNLLDAYEMLCRAHYEAGERGPRPLKDWLISKFGTWQVSGAQARQARRMLNAWRWGAFEAHRRTLGPIEPLSLSPVSPFFAEFEEYRALVDRLIFDAFTKPPKVFSGITFVSPPCVSFAKPSRDTTTGPGGLPAYLTSH